MLPAQIRAQTTQQPVMAMPDFAEIMHDQGIAQPQGFLSQDLDGAVRGRVMSQTPASGGQLLLTIMSIRHEDFF